MSITADNVSYTWSSSSESSDVADKPYLTKELLYVIDNNGSKNYSRNQVQFETIALSNNGKWCDYKNGFISIPLVTTLTSSVDMTEDQLAIQMKSGNHNIIDSVIIDYGNNNVVQQNANLNAYLSFKQHTTLSENDIAINGRTTGYRKDQNNWNYKDGTGIVNNHVSSNSSLDRDSTLYDAQKEKVLSNVNVRQSGENHLQIVDDKNHVFYYDCIVRLKDLLFFEKLPMVRGANVKITINLNQAETTYKIVNNDVNSITKLQLNGSTQPVMRTQYQDLSDRDETVVTKVVSNGAYDHVKNQCRLYVPVYTMSPEAEKSYLSIGQKKIVYEDLFVQHIRNVPAGSNFQNLLTNSLARMQRLVIVPMLSKSANGAGHWTPQESPFTSEPSTCSPCFIRDFNIQLSGSNLYKQNIQYKYEHFLNELNGSQGVNANLTDGLCSSLIDMKDYHNNFGYIVVDLSRRYAYDDQVPMSVQIQGNLASVKNLDLLCFITYQKDVTIDLITGQQVS